MTDPEDHSKWNEFYARYRDLIISLARKAGLSEEEAKEVFQEILIAVAKEMRRSTYDPDKASFKAWLLSVIWSRIQDVARRKAENSAMPPAEDPAAPGLTASEREARLLKMALARIKLRVQPKSYQIYYHHVILGQPVEEVAKALDATTAQIYLAKHRVGRLVKEEVSRLRRTLLGGNDTDL